MGVLPVPPHAILPTETHGREGRNAGESAASHFALRAAIMRSYSRETGVSTGLSLCCHCSGSMRALLLEGGKDEEASRKRRQTSKLSPGRLLKGRPHP